MINVAIAATMFAGLTAGQCEPPGTNDFVTVRAVVRQAASGLNTTSGNPPASSGSVQQGDPYVVELWAQQMDATLSGFNCVYADVTFDSGMSSCSSVAVATEFSEFGVAGSCSTGAAIDVGGCSFTPATLGVTPQWVRVATVTMSATVAGAANITADQASDPLRRISVLGCGNVPTSRISFEGSTFTILAGTCMNNGQCDDGAFCNGMETCLVGTGCQPGTDPCNGALCNEVNDTCAGVCANAGDCDNGDFCDGDETCNPGHPNADSFGCVAASFGPCFFTQCDEFNDECVQCFQNAQCSDDLTCNGQEECINNTCVDGTPINCPAIDPATPFCNEASDTCVECNVSGHCTDGLFCNGVETCVNNVCVNGTPPCTDAFGCTVDACNESNDTCSFTPDNAACDNGVFCDGAETCSASSGCLDGSPPCPAGICDEGSDTCGACTVNADCNDGVPCTVDTCEPNNTCLNRPDDTPCDNGFYCDGPEICQPSSPMANGNGCVASAGPVNCSDGIACTVDTCNESLDSCVHTSSNALCNNGFFCDGLEVCDPDDPGANPSGCVDADEIDCNDGIDCTEDFCSDVLQSCVNSSAGCPPTCASAFQRIDLSWRPANLIVTDTELPILVDLQLWATPNGPGVEVQDVQAIIGWDPAILAIQEVVGIGSYQWADASYQDDSSIDNLNDGIFTPPLGVPFNDGNALFVAQGNLPPPLGIGPNVIDLSGELIATIRFSVVDPAILDTTVDFIDSFGCTCTTVFWAGKPGCGIERNFASATVVGACTDDCADADDNNVIDDICTFQNCQLDNCVLEPRLFPADMGGAFGACPKDNFCNIHDRNHALNCFAGQTTCDLINLDAGGAFGVCPADGFCNVHDANHALNCFAGTNSCNTTCGPAPEMPGGDGGWMVQGATGLSVVANRRAIGAGDTIDVRVFSDDPLDDLQSYQLELQVSGGDGGYLELVNIAIEPRKDHAFAGLDETPFDAFNVTRGQMLAGLGLGGVATWADAYLATYTYRASADASGSFVIDVRSGSSADAGQTYLVADFIDEVAVTGSRPAVIQVSASKRDVRRTARRGQTE